MALLAVALLAVALLAVALADSVAVHLQRYQKAAELGVNFTGEGVRSSSRTESVQVDISRTCHGAELSSAVRSATPRDVQQFRDALDQLRRPPLLHRVRMRSDRIHRRVLA